METVKCALGKRRPSHEWNDGKKDRIYCYGYVDRRTDCLLPECEACPDHVDKAQGDLEAHNRGAGGKETDNAGDMLGDGNGANAMK